MIQLESIKLQIIKNIISKITIKFEKLASIFLIKSKNMGDFVKREDLRAQTESVDPAKGCSCVKQ